MNRLQIWHKNVVTVDLLYKLNSTNLHNITQLKTIILKSTINTSVSEPKDIIFGLVILELLSNQKAKILKTRKSIAAFKTRKSIPISSKVTIRSKNLYNYMDFLICVVLPKLSELNSLSIKSVANSKKSLSIGLSNLGMFPQLTKELEHLPKNIGLTVTFNISLAKSNLILLLLLSELQVPVVL